MLSWQLSQRLSQNIERKLKHKERRLSGVFFLDETVVLFYIQQVINNLL